jgi:hypothetical protein
MQQAPLQSIISFHVSFTHVHMYGLQRERCEHREHTDQRTARQPRGNTTQHQQYARPARLRVTGAESVGFFLLSSFYRVHWTLALSQKSVRLHVVAYSSIMAGKSLKKYKDLQKFAAVS